MTTDLEAAASWWRRAAITSFRWGVDLVDNPGKRLRFAVVRCPFCGQEHIHDWPEIDIDVPRIRMSKCGNRTIRSYYVLTESTTTDTEHQAMTDLPHIPSLRQTESSGRHERAGLTDDEVAMGVKPWAGRPCGGCQRLTAEGEQITHYLRAWWHLSCAQLDLAAGSAIDAWLTLGHQLARSPGDFKVGETRAIVGALLGIAEKIASRS